MCVVTLSNTLIRIESEGECVDGVYMLVLIFTHSKKWCQGAGMPFNSAFFAASSFLPPVPLHPVQQKRTEPNPRPRHPFFFFYIYIKGASRASNKWLCAALAREREKGGWGGKNSGMCALQLGDFKGIPGKRRGLQEREPERLGGYLEYGSVLAVCAERQREGEQLWMNRLSRKESKDLKTQKSFNMIWCDLRLG